jgi:predicted nucleic acid-binding protein
LNRYRQVFDEIPRLGIEVLQIAPHLLKVAGAVCQGHGFLMGDGLIIALMQDESITSIASHDPDFDRVPGITRYAPA